MKKVGVILLLLALGLLLILFFSIKDDKSEKAAYEKAAGALYELFWNEDEENAAKMGIKFQNDFGLSDSHMDELKQLSSDYYFASSDLWYSMQNELASSPDASSNEQKKISMKFKENSETLTQNYLDSVSKILVDREALIDWMSKHFYVNSTAQNQPNQ
ncbi:MAG: hypothetical protein K0Q87_4827 [Neobacillus sp.]|nr:hypothetical protein [Neobacillus sp.]